MIKYKMYFSYFKYVLEHKWYVFIECCNFGMPVRGLLHDLSKFRPSEFIPYAKFFYEPNGDKKQRRNSTGYYKATDTGDIDFDMAWFYHQSRNKHHWQHWIIPENDGKFKCIKVPEKYLKERVADWRGAAQAQGFSRDVCEWYKVNNDKMIVNESDREYLEKLIGYKRL